MTSLLCLKYFERFASTCWVSLLLFPPELTSLRPHCFVLNVGFKFTSDIHVAKLNSQFSSFIFFDFSIPFDSTYYCLLLKDFSSWLWDTIFFWFSSSWQPFLKALAVFIVAVIFSVLLLGSFRPSSLECSFSLFGSTQLPFRSQPET